MLKLFLAAIFLFTSLSPLQAFHEERWQSSPQLHEEDDDQQGVGNEVAEVQKPLAYLQQHENDGVHLKPQLTDEEIMEKYKNIKDIFKDLKNGTDPGNKL
jgi:hypothetical protein